MNKEDLEFLINHIVLPPKLPQAEEQDRRQKEGVLLQILSETVNEFTLLVEENEDAHIIKTWRFMKRMFSSMKELHSSRILDKYVLEKKLNNLQIGDVLPLHISAQNAGVIMRKITDDMLTFESFELMLPTGTVMGTEGKILMIFPANPRLAVQNDPHLLSTLANMFSYLDATVLDKAMPHTSKGGAKHEEIRDTPSPLYINEAIHGILRAISPMKAPRKTTFIQKRLDDQVLWDSALLPWRRSPIWLLARVALQSTLTEMNVATGAFGYKAFQSYFMATIMKRTIIGKEFPTSDFLHFMIIRVAKKLWKIREITDDPANRSTKFAADCVERASEALSNRWSDIRKLSTRCHPWRKFTAEEIDDSKLFTLENSREYLSKIELRHRVHPESSMTKDVLNFEANMRDKVTTIVYQSKTLPVDICEKEPLLGLYRFEQWVDSSLKDWASTASEKDCLSIFRIYEKYSAAAQKAYSSNPERLSMMYLIIMELWVVMDQIVTTWCPLVNDYFCDINPRLFEPLLLPQYSDMARLHKIEKYLQSRHSFAQSRTAMSIFHPMPTSNMFSVRYFDSSSYLKGRKVAIDESTNLKKASTTKKLEELNERYRELTASAERMACEFVTLRNRYGHQYTKHDRWCGKCGKTKQAGQLQIEVFEEPLPNDTIYTKQIVFELYPPEPFIIWRDMTYRILISSSIANTGASDQDYLLSSYHPLSEFYTRDSIGRRVGLASHVKAISGSHYSGKSIPTTISSVIVPHAGKLYLSDTETKVLLPLQWSSGSFRSKCSFKLSESLSFLQASVDDTLQPPNYSIATLSTCPSNMSYEEFLTFSQLRGGKRIQMINLGRALVNGSLPLGNENTHLLVLQLLWQAESAENQEEAESGKSVYRSAHLDFSDSSFTTDMLNILSNKLLQLKRTYKDCISMSTLVAIALRILSMTPSEKMELKALEFLSQARNMAHDWLEKAKLEFRSSDSTNMARNQLYLGQVALTARYTFDVDEDHLEIIFKEAQAATQFLYAGILAKFLPPQLPPHLKLLVERDRTLSFRTEGVLFGALKGNNKVLDRVVKEVWSGYEAGGCWSYFRQPMTRLLKVSTPKVGSLDSAVVHLDILDGNLRVDTKTVGHLPPEYISHSTYKVLFGSSPMPLTYPSKLPGMSYQATWEGNEVHFGLRNDLIVCIRRDGLVEEFIPSAVFMRDIPSSLLEDASLWYICEKRLLEIRLATDPWTTDLSRRWRMELSEEHRGHLIKGTSERGLDPHSTVYKTIQSLLSPIESSSTGLLIRSIESNDLNKLIISITRLNLDFFIDGNHRLQCQTFPNFIYDSDQDSGCLYGLKNYLILRQINATNPIRRIIIPDGSVIIKRVPHGHPTVQIVPKTGVHGYHTFDIDAGVNHLKGSRETQSDLLITYLHAVTSFPLPDPLTGRTGTEEAMSRIDSSFSFWALSQEEVALLNQISRLTPIRVFYPPHLEVMERVEWNEDLPFTSQHPSFRKLALSILQLWTDVSCLHGIEEVPATITHEDKLTERQTRRLEILWCNDLHLPVSVTPDTLVHSRDSLRMHDSRAREQKTHHISHIAFSPPTHLPVCTTLSGVFKDWSSVLATETWDISDIPSWFNGPPSEILCTLIERFRLSRVRSFDHIFCLGMLAFRDISTEIMTALVMLAKHRIFEDDRYLCPVEGSIDLSYGSSFDDSRITRILTEYSQPFDLSDEAKIKLLEDESFNAWKTRATAKYQRALSQELAAAVNEIRQFWTNGEEDNISVTPRRLLRVHTGNAIQQCQENLTLWRQNESFLTYLYGLERQLADYHGPEMPSQIIYEGHTRPPLMNRLPFEFISRSHLLGIRSAPVPKAHISKKSPSSPSASSSSPQKDLGDLLDRFRHLAQTPLEKKYLDGLSASASASIPDNGTSVIPSKLDLLNTMKEQSKTSKMILQAIIELLSPTSYAEMVLATASLWPQFNNRRIMEQLSFKRRHSLRQDWLEAFQWYAFQVTNQKKLERLVLYSETGKVQELQAEWSNQGVDKVSNYIDWVLIEIDANFSTRSKQVDVAEAMLFPEDKGNKVVQLNMGEGKSSVIVPLISSTIANGSMLARIIVPKPQARELFLLLKQRLTGLTGRRVFYLPFNRSLNLTQSQVKRIHRLISEFRKEGAIWICPPEQVQSLKLLALDWRLRSIPGADILLKIQKSLHNFARDILDESDEVLRTRHQLVYTMGSQQHLDAAPARWIITQQFLDIVKRKLRELRSNQKPHFLVAPSKSWEFPRVRILSRGQGRKFIREVVEEIVYSDCLVEFSLCNFSTAMKQTIIEFITSPSVSQDTFAALKDFCLKSGDPMQWQKLLLLRGLVCQDILIMALKDKRWRVDFGLDIRRSQMAIPFHAKDTPSLKSEFGHTDAAITLTCLAYYYYGLNSAMMLDTLELVLSSEDPDLIYSEWIAECREQIPQSFITLNGLDLEDLGNLVTQLYPILRLNKKTIDFYLANKVFPRGAKEFPSKMATSGWDLAIRRKNPTTGFSGTNDNRFLLPLSIQQYESSAQLFTNAAVLSNILLEENREVLECGNNPTSKELIDLIASLSPEVKVFLDVGAQVFDGSNQSFAKAWLKRTKSASINAAVFINKDDERCVITRSGEVQPLVRSPFENRLEECLVYLDEVHTRGMDLRLPIGTRAVVTLGPKLTKDKLVQGCMRMRKLGKGHSLIFLVPDEVAKLIRKITNKNQISNSDILLWTMKETCVQLQANLSEWAEQGYRFAHRQQAWTQLFEGIDLKDDILKDHVCESEPRTLESLYGYHQPTSFSQHVGSYDSSLRREINERCSDFSKGTLAATNGRINEEQEVELVYEKEMEYEIERPPLAAPAAHTLCPFLPQFCKTGQYSLSSDLFSIERVVRHTGLKLPSGIIEMLSGIAFTPDFTKTIQANRGVDDDYMSSFLRRVEWILRSQLDEEKLIIISPFEADCIIPLIRKSQLVSLHCFSARLSRSMNSMENLIMFTIPSTATIPPPSRHLIHCINLFAGSLYVENYDSYEEISGLLGLCLGEAIQGDIELDSTGFIRDPTARKEKYGSAGFFSSTPVPFFRELFNLRRHGRSFAPTHMGKILNAKGLSKRDFS